MVVVGNQRQITLAVAVAVVHHLNIQNCTTHPAGAIDTTQGPGGYSDASTNIGNVTINNAASNSCEVIVDFGGNYNFLAQQHMVRSSHLEYLIKGQSASVNNTTLKLAGSGSTMDH